VFAQRWGEVVCNDLFASSYVGIHWKSYPLPWYVSGITTEVNTYLTRDSDEFDVFMDAVNRRTAMKMMVRDFSTVSLGPNPY